MRSGTGAPGRTPGYGVALGDRVRIGWPTLGVRVGWNRSNGPPRGLGPASVPTAPGEGADLFGGPEGVGAGRMAPRSGPVGLSGIRYDRGIPVRPYRTTALPPYVRHGPAGLAGRTPSGSTLLRTRGATATGPSLIGPESRSGGIVGTQPTGWTDGNRWPDLPVRRAARPVGTGVVPGQAATVTSVGSTSVHDEPSSAERTTASSTSWTWRASANDGVGSVPVAIASRKSRISWVNECS